MEPKAAWPGHADPLTGDVRAQLERLRRPPVGKRARRRDRDGSGGPPGPSSFADLGIDLDLGGPDPAALAEADRDLGDFGVLTLRTGMSPGTRTEYAAPRKGQRSTAASTQEDALAPAVEFLFERLVLRWEVAGVVTDGPQGPA